MPVPHGRRLHLPPAPSEPLRAQAEAFDELPRGEGTIGLLGIDLRVVECAQDDRVHAQGLGQLVHGDLERHHAGRFARRPHGTAFRQIEHGKTKLGHPVRCGIEQSRGSGCRLGTTAGQISGQALVTDSRDAPIPVRADADVLHRRRAMRRIVEHQGALQRHLDRPSDGPRPERRQHQIRQDGALSAEAAADEGGNEPDVLLGNAQCPREVAYAPVELLYRGPTGKPLAVPRGDRCVWLHHRMGMVWCRIDLIELHRCARIGAREIADAGLGRRAIRTGLGGVAISPDAARSKPPLLRT